MRAPTCAIFVAVTAAVCVALSAPAEAAFPGKNGRIAYVKAHLEWTTGGSDGEPEPDPIPDLYTINPDGSGRRPFARSAEEPRFSPNGRLVAFQDFLDTIFIKPTYGGPKWRLAPRLGGDSVEGTPAWSPFGGRLVAAFGSSLFTLDDDGTRMHRLRHGFEPDWSIKNRIVFQNNKGIATMAPGGGHLHRLRVGGQPRWSPDGRWIVFERDLPRDRVGIAIMRADGSQPRILTRGPWDRSPVWSPEGHHIAYVHRNRRKRREKIVVMRTDGKGRRAILAVPRHPKLQSDSYMLQDLDWQPLPF